MLSTVITPPSFEKKICSIEEVSTRLEIAPRPLVFTNGVFDILHRGHITYLAQARELGAFLIVGINSDISTRCLGKAPDRPIHPQADRMAMLAALAAVDLVILFNESTPLSLLKKIQPDIYVKGGDYDIEQLEETKCIRSWGGHALTIPIIHTYSTTQLLQRIRAL